MKNVLLLLIPILFLSCSSDDSNKAEETEETVDLKISKLTEAHNNDTFIRYYNEDGTVSKEIWIFDGSSENERPYSLFIYNDQQNLESIKLYSENDEFARNHRTYEYNSNNQLVKLTDYGDGTHEPYHTTFTYSTNRVDFEELETERSGYIKFDNKGKIIETYHQSGPSFWITNFIKYKDNQVSEISQLNGRKYIFETVDTPNPLFQFFIKKPMQYILTEHYLYDIDFTFDTSYSINNVTTIHNIPGGKEETVFQYKKDDYPISSTTIREDGSVIERSFEYY
ncbi:hypothetical protein [Marixanthomonas spongiae]|uniref:DUF4595 domain-containing protein n=1 Tax=Marixanthomonas spongiae TaxID=2174845 RepID=A0A2U0I7X5_9FLAO|nr:hypothetical protein [Marixanthomonas spongiae]PVW17199.1 hypothetical protein DDV96_01405 [Marixanthomonas spongiae]